MRRLVRRMFSSRKRCSLAGQVALPSLRATHGGRQRNQGDLWPQETQDPIRKPLRPKNRRVLFTRGNSRLSRNIWGGRSDFRLQEGAEGGLAWTSKEMLLCVVFNADFGGCGSPPCDCSTSQFRIACRQFGRFHDAEPELCHPASAISGVFVCCCYCITM